MEPILNKGQIDDLLQGIKEGRVSLDLDNADTSQFAKECTPLDLFHLAALKDENSRIPNFDIILDNYAQNLAISLTNQMQRNFSISRKEMETSHFIDFILANKDPGAIAVLDISPLKQGALILIDSQMAFTMVEVLLGASTETPLLQPHRKLTNIELTVMNTVMSKCSEDLNRAFSQVIDLKSSILRIENNSRLVSIADSDAEILIGTFTLSTSDVKGEMKLVFPTASLDPIVTALADLLSVSKSKKGLWAETLESETEELEVNVIAQSGFINLQVKDVLNFREGDILFIDYDPNAPLHILVENREKFQAIPGTHHGKKAISITAIQN